MYNFLSVSKWIFVGVVLALPIVAQAVDITSISGKWTSTTGGQNVTGVNTNQIKWGGDDQSSIEKSGYNFVASPNLFNIDPNTPFVLGTFTHINNVIPSGTSITKAVLAVSLTIPNVIQNLNLSYVFNHNETPNVAGQCPAGSTSVCDDIVTAVSNPVVTQTFTLNGKEYTLTISGFQVNGNTFTNFLTREGADNSALLIAQISAPVPEPSTYLLLGSTLGMLMFLKHRRAKQRA